MRLLHRTGPDGDVFVTVELALEAEDVLRPGAAQDLVALLEAGAGLAHRNTLGAVFPRGAAGDPGDQPPVGEAVEHGQLLGQPQRLVQRQEVAVDQQLHPLSALRRSGHQQVRRVHQAIGRGVVLVHPHAVEAQPLHLGPGVQMLPIGLDRRLRLEVAGEELARQPAVLAEPVDVRLVVHQVEDEDLHSALLRAALFEQAAPRPFP